MAATCCGSHASMVKLLMRETWTPSVRWRPAQRRHTNVPCDTEAQSGECAGQSKHTLKKTRGNDAERWCD
jgi:hypothetical protein